MRKPDCKICQTGEFCMYHGALEGHPVVTPAENQGTEGGFVPIPNAVGIITVDFPAIHPAPRILAPGEHQDEEEMIPNVLGSNVGSKDARQLEQNRTFAELYGGDPHQEVDRARRFDHETFQRGYKKISDRIDQDTVEDILSCENLLDAGGKIKVLDGQFRLRVAEEVRRDEASFDQIIQDTFKYGAFRTKAFETALKVAESVVVHPEVTSRWSSKNPCAEIPLGNPQPINLKGPARERLKNRSPIMYDAVIRMGSDLQMREYMFVKVMEVFDLFDRLKEAENNEKA